MQPLSLSNLGRGAAAELFEQAWARVLENVQDPNTDHKKPRTVTIKITVKPDQDRRSGAVELVVTTSLAGVKPFKTNIFIGDEGRGMVAYENDPKQMGLFQPAEPDPAKVRNIEAAMKGEQQT